MQLQYKIGKFKKKIQFFLKDDPIKAYLVKCEKYLVFNGKILRS
jgi:hypothetical protein